ncbi:hypothetical protein P6166_14530 [Stenotrophomonas sp. HITSZ_GD]|uniref:hypothetical protein n=1 Tax=Stenotrophomonas sp. HITSZ_GD TaxID=3037248 RepID=UPI00240DE03A|nr:hypothetical protein [Stenotrophomonas sp. HITSZ_GD]MDG2526570.1 hypothetical protein [Stenotrophomonas sp. HITSZ_GD]
MEAWAESRHGAAEGFNQRVHGHTWLPRDMALHEVYLHDLAAGERPLLRWLPTRDIGVREAAALAVGVPLLSIHLVHRVASPGEASAPE